LFLLYPLGIVPFTYVTSFVFNNENVAQTVTIFLHFAFAGIGAIATMILRIIQSTWHIGDRLHWALKICPSFSLTYPIMFQASKDRLYQARPDLEKSDMSIDFVGGDIAVMAGHFGFWLIVLVLIEVGTCSCLSKVPLLCKKNRIQKKEDLELDEDVVNEENRVITEPNTNKPVVVQSFRKVYPSVFRKPVVAVERTSFGLDYGECFALLGVNGAGKTTTFRALT